MADLTVTVASVLKGTGANIGQGTTGPVALTAGMPIYLDASGTISISDANGASAARDCIGIALHASSPGQPIDYITSGGAFAHGMAGSVSGDSFYVSDNVGRITNVIGDLASGSTIIFLGNATSATVMKLQILVGGVK